MTTTVTVTQPSITAENVLQLFPDVNASLIGTAQSTANDTDLTGYDEEQIRLLEEVCIVISENDTPIGSCSKKTCKLGLCFHLQLVSY